MLRGLLGSRDGGLRGLLGRRRRGAGHVTAFLGLLGGGGVGVSLVLAVLLDEVGKVLDSAGTGVFDGGVLATGREELDGRETLDGLGDVVGGGVDLGDGHLVGEFGVLSVELGELLVLGGEAVMELAIWQVLKK